MGVLRRCAAVAKLAATVRAIGTGTDQFRALALPLTHPPVMTNPRETYYSPACETLLTGCKARKTLTLGKRESLIMNLLRETRVLAILCIVASAALWASGCVGVGAAKSSTTTAPSATSNVVSPATAAVAASGQTQFTASIQGVTSGNSVTWTATVGTITKTEMFTAPAKGGTGTITATSVVDPTKSTTVAVTVAAAGQPSGSTVTSVIVSPASGASITGGTVS
jgi:hypothetical protein